MNSKKKKKRNDTGGKSGTSTKMNGKYLGKYNKLFSPAKLFKICFNIESKTYVYGVFILYKSITYDNYNQKGGVRTGNYINESPGLVKGVKDEL